MCSTRRRALRARPPGRRSRPSSSSRRHPRRGPGAEQGRLRQVRLEDLLLDALPDLPLRPRRSRPREGRLDGRVGLRRPLAPPELPGPEADPAPLLRLARGVRAEQHHPELHPGGGRGVRRAGAQPDGPPDRPPRREAPEADRPRADPHLPVRDPLRRAALPGAHVEHPDLVHGGDGLLLRERRGREGPDVHPRRGELRPDSPDHARQHRRLPGLPLRPRLLRLRRGRVGEGRRPRARLRVPVVPRARTSPRPSSGRSRSSPTTST